VNVPFASVDMKQAQARSAGTAAALALHELLQDFLEHLGGIILAALGALAALAAALLLFHLLNHLHDLVQNTANSA
jgi:hypothetical protein